MYVVEYKIPNNYLVEGRSVLVSAIQEASIFSTQEAASQEINKLVMCSGFVLSDFYVKEVRTITQFMVFKTEAPPANYNQVMMEAGKLVDVVNNNVWHYMKKLGEEV